MEIIIGMVIAFIAGAYVRKPFAATIRKRERPAPPGVAEAEHVGLSVEEQLCNMLNYNVDTPFEGRM